MTISIKVSVNGNYKIPVTTQYGDGEPTTEIISGRGLNQPYVKDIPYYHGSSSSQLLKITVGPQESDNA